MEKEKVFANVEELASNREIMTFLRASMAKFDLTFEEKADLIQETLSKYHENDYLSKFDPTKGNFRTYISVPLANRAKTLLAKRKAHFDKVPQVIQHQQSMQYDMDTNDQPDIATIIAKIKQLQKPAFSWISYHDSHALVEDKRGKKQRYPTIPTYVGKKFYRDAASAALLASEGCNTSTIAIILKTSVGFVRGLLKEARAISQL